MPKMMGVFLPRDKGVFLPRSGRVVRISRVFLSSKSWQGRCYYLEHHSQARWVPPNSSGQQLWCGIL